MKIINILRMPLSIPIPTSPMQRKGFAFLFGCLTTAFSIAFIAFGGGGPCGPLLGLPFMFINLPGILIVSIVQFYILNLSPDSEEVSGIGILIGCVIQTPLWIYFWNRYLLRKVDLVNDVNKPKEITQ